MIEEVLVTLRANPKIDPVLSTWSWEVPLYLFLGGLAAGIMFFAAIMVLANRQREAPFVTEKLVLWTVILLSVGMAALFLDLSHRWYVFRFYTAFRPSSPMSWGSWILIIIYPICLLQILSTFRQGYPNLARRLERFDIGALALDLSERFRRRIAWISIPFALALGIYTGLLLNTLVARPFWNTAILPVLFLVSALSTAAALTILGTSIKGERNLFTQIDFSLIAVEIFLVLLLVIDLSTGSQVQLAALDLILGGRYTVGFWLLFFSIGLLIPILLEGRELLRKSTSAFYLAPLFVLIGGYLLRQVVMNIGLHSSWVDYANQFDPQLLQLLQ
ncbi:MAG: polysulfide reductase NrfD [Gammaproteobacteria bacterium]|nr:polysulfide reductase NrfD [Gammaproteobacteria bacterium]MDH3466027.1 polysulfide reductase NrfD [Gammaproteobacteria bacterium]